MNRITTETAAAVKARQMIVPAWMDEFDDDSTVEVTTFVTPFGDYVIGMIDLTDMDEEDAWHLDEQAKQGLRD